RLARARNLLDLAEPLIVERGGMEAQDELLPVLRFTRHRFDMMGAEHRAWRYTDFYESPQTKRIVQRPRQVQHALMTFGQMRERHKGYFADLAGLFDELPRPDAEITRVPNGDLWEMVRDAINDLAEFTTTLEPVRY